MKKVKYIVKGDGIMWIWSILILEKLNFKEVK